MASKKGKGCGGGSKSSGGKKTVPVEYHERSTPSTCLPGRNYPKPGPKTVPVKKHKRSPPK